MSNIDLSALITADAKLTAARDKSRDRLATVRWRHETGGLVMADGTRIATTRDSQAQIANAATAVRAGLITAPVPWKTLQGWVELPPEALLDIAARVSAHVQACFLAERTVAQMIADTDDLDLEAEFAAALAVV